MLLGRNLKPDGLKALLMHGLRGPDGPLFPLAADYPEFFRSRLLMPVPNPLQPEPFPSRLAAPNPGQRSVGRAGASAGKAEDKYMLIRCCRVSYLE